MTILGFMLLVFISAALLAHEAELRAAARIKARAVIRRLTH